MTNVVVIFMLTLVVRVGTHEFMIRSRRLWDHFQHCLELEVVIANLEVKCFTNKSGKIHGFERMISITQSFQYHCRSERKSNHSDSKPPTRFLLVLYLRAESEGTKHGFLTFSCKFALKWRRIWCRMILHSIPCLKMFLARNVNYVVIISRRHKNTVYRLQVLIDDFSEENRPQMTAHFKQILKKVGTW